MNIENITKKGKEYIEAKDKVVSIQETIKRIDSGVSYHAKLEVEFSGMYRRSSKEFGLTEAELKNILNTRLNEAINHMGLLKKQFDKVV